MQGGLSEKVRKGAKHGALRHSKHSRINSCWTWFVLRRRPFIKSPSEFKGGSDVGRSSLMENIRFLYNWRLDTYRRRKNSMAFLRPKREGASSPRNKIRKGVWL